MSSNVPIHTAHARCDCVFSKYTPDIDRFQRLFDLKAKQDFAIASRGSSGGWSTCRAAGHVP
jgi:hypothetical protein